MTRRANVVRLLRAVGLVLLFSATLTGCHELYCNFVEGLTGVPVDCSHDAFPDLGDIELPPLPPPPTLPTTTTTTTLPPTSTTSSTVPSDTTTTSSTTTSTTSPTTSSTSTSVPVTTPGASSVAGELETKAVADAVRAAARERAGRR